jgi:hypothetical protein
MALLVGCGALLAACGAGGAVSATATTPACEELAGCRRACDAGSAIGCENLGEVLRRFARTGESQEAYQRACDLGSQTACAATR